MEPNLNDVINGTLSPIAFMFTLGGTWKVLLLIGTAFIGLCTLVSGLLIPAFFKETRDSEKDSSACLHIAALSGLAFLIELCLPISVYQVAVNFIRALPLPITLIAILGIILLPDFIKDIKKSCEKWRMKKKKQKSGTSSYTEMR